VVTPFVNDVRAAWFLGTPLLCEVLSEIGERELAYTLLLQRKFPSWLYSIDQGATTMWERWDGYTKERGFGDVGMNSYNHYAYGAVVAWLFEHAAGIKPDKNGGWRSFTLAPEPDRRLGRLKASLRTEFGVIESNWEYSADGRCRWTYSVPEGSSATVVLPGGKTSEVQSGKGELLLW
jgi:alpha-L-rhamnosidase